jgi:epoxide hydrolase-like predicted phosphatase
LWSHLYASEAWEEAKRGHITRDAFWQERLGALDLFTEEERTAFKQRLYRNRGIRPEMAALLRTLHGRIRLAVLSNTPRRDLARYLAERRGLDGLFEAVISSAAVGLAKPEPAIFRLALDRLGLQPHEVLFVDDLARNTQAAETLGIPSIVFTSVAALHHELRKRGILD